MGVVENLFVGFVLGLSSIASPGPFNAYLANLALKGWKRAFIFGIGNAISDFVLMGATIMLYEMLRSKIEGFLCYFYLASAVIFAYLAFDAYKGGEHDKTEGKPISGSFPLFLKGLTIGVVNPVQITWWLTAGLASISMFGIPWMAGLALSGMIWISLFPKMIETGCDYNSRLATFIIKLVSTSILLAFSAYFLLLFIIKYL
ncbi:MAG: LysE family translocator [Thermoproteota archaeon]|jgi:threonine/homoserine/homoserine lactone efflux protein|uniref:LysE family translocator n=1 Tax=Candidatus Methanodesulfokora washburnensis TaxID=2478471 RepID=A0A3R9PG80_9CREN|nr:LysE family transporter [Candidatus Methanodesulfokores washburnensis]RSN72561.1 LysE family translocator [Candidatus Methanodesulfokores washburnensis]RZN62203.1 MAG: LysE family translocator [Candidatus Methanodesulfokores washburnensis]TDA38836.1 MAG: LysE family translocator [Candidatus Korarchaeota archaeon]